MEVQTEHIKQPIYKEENDSNVHSDRSADMPQTTKQKPAFYDVIIGTGFGSGFWPWGPGTAGAAAATLIWCAYAYLLPVPFAVVNIITLALIAIFTLLSLRPIDRLEKSWGEDPSRVVIDEMVGVWIALLAVPPTKEWYYVLAAFILFRIMDITKPLGCRWLDNNIHGGLGVMLDDMLAGVYAAIVLFIIVIWPIIM